MKTNLRQLLERASDDFESYKSPDLGELLEVLNPVLSAAKKTPFTHVTIVRILEGTSNGVKYFEFWIEWISSTCWQTAEVTLLSRIVDAEDPVLEAKKVSLEENIQVSENAIKALEKSLADHQSHLVKLLKDQRELLSCS